MTKTSLTLLVASVVAALTISARSASSAPSNQQIVDWVKTKLTQHGDVSYTEPSGSVLSESYRIEANQRCSVTVSPWAPVSVSGTTTTTRPIFRYVVDFSKLSTEVTVKRRNKWHQPITVTVGNKKQTNAFRVWSAHTEIVLSAATKAQRAIVRQYWGQGEKKLSKPSEASLALLTIRVSSFAMAHRIKRAFSDLAKNCGGKGEIY